MVYPTSLQTFPEQFPTTVADNDFINDITNLLVALENTVGLSGDPPGTGSHESRLKRLEGGGLPRFFFSATTPGGTPQLNDIWINTASEPWIEYYWNGSTWHVMGSDSVFIGSKQFDSTSVPSDNQAPVYKASLDRVQWGNILTNPLSNEGEIIVGGTGGTLTPLAPGNDYDVFTINSSTNLPEWAPTPKYFDQLYLRQYMDFVLHTTPSPSASGELRLYASSSPLGLYYSVNGGSYQAIGGGLGDLSALLNSTGSMLYASDNSGTLAELGIGGEGAALLAIGGIPTWRTNAFVPVPGATLSWSFLYFDGSTWLPLGPGTDGQFLRTHGTSAAPEWTDLPSSPAGGAITAPVGAGRGAILYHNGTDWTFLAPGTAGRYLQTQGSTADPIWAVLPPSMTNPMTTPGDMIYATIGGAPTRLAFGTANNDKFLSVVGGVPALVDSPASLGKSLWMAG